MSLELNAIRSGQKGAIFVRADLHIHSYGPDGSYDVSDPEMTPEAIVSVAHTKGLGVIAITDHNAIGNVERARAAASTTNVLVVPGVELSTSGGHFLAYAETFAQLQQFLAQLEFSQDRKACRTSPYDMLQALAKVGGLAIAAHVDLDSGLEKAIPGYGDPKSSVICSPTLVAIEVANITALNWYSKRDEHADRRRLLEERLRKSNDPFVSHLPKIQSSDAHRLSALGRNYEQKEKLTRLKMHARDWASFRRAFLDPDARVRLEEEIPSATPRFVGIHLTGGFLNGQTFPFSPNLTCIIGGRGSGKSTAFQALRSAASKPPPADLARSDTWPHQIDALYRNEYGAEIHFRIDAFGDLANLTTNDEPAPIIQVESLAQGEMARTIAHCGEDPAAFHAFLDELAQVGSAKEVAAQKLALLVDNGSKIARLEQDVAQLESVQKQLKSEEAKEKIARAEKGHEIVDQQKKLAAAMNVRVRLTSSLDDVFANLSAALSDQILDGFRDLNTLAQTQLAHMAENPLPAVLSAIETQMNASKKAFDSLKIEGSKRIATFAIACQREQDLLQTELNKKVQDLRERGIPIDIKSLTSLTANIAKLRQQETALKRKEGELKALYLARVNLRAEYRTSQRQTSRLRIELASDLRNQLPEILVDLQLSLKFLEGQLAPELEESIKGIMDWRTAAVPKAAALVRAMGAPTLVDALCSANATSLAKAIDDEQAILSATEVAALVERFKIPANRRAIEETNFDDMPRMTITRFVTDDEVGNTTIDPHTKKPRVMSREFAKLSLGQQQAIVLGMLLCSSSQTPLLIDQPEDNLDSAFIFKVLVRALRRIKERRQVILVTHNANIGVLSDADLIVPLKATAENGIVQSPGSIETKRTRELVCEILEGGRDAYKRRGVLYGDKDS